MSDEDQADRWDGRERDALYTLVPGNDQDWMSVWSVTMTRWRCYVCASRAGVKAVAMIGKVV